MTSFKIEDWDDLREAIAEADSRVEPGNPKTRLRGFRYKDENGTRLFCTDPTCFKRYKDKISLENVDRAIVMHELAPGKQWGECSECDKSIHTNSF